MSVIVEADPTRAETLRSALGPGVPVLATIDDLRRHLDAHPGEDAVVLGPSVDQEAAFVLSDGMRIARPSLGIVLVRRRIDTPLLVDALRAGVREVVEERNLAGVNDAVKRVRDVAAAMRQRSNHDDGEDSGRGVVVTVFSAKGGCGKTTLASNLAASLADGGRRDVCLVDLDLNFGDVAIVLQLFPAHTLADAVPMMENLDLPAVTALLTPHSPGLSALVAPVEPGSAETVPASLITSIIGLLREQFAYVVDRHPAGVHRPCARGVRSVRPHRAARDARHPGAEEPEADAGDARSAELPAGAAARGVEPRRLQGGPGVVGGREDAESADRAAHPVVASGACVDQPRRSDSCSTTRTTRSAWRSGSSARTTCCRCARTGSEPIPSNLRSDRRGLLRRRSKA